jgi:hypothetical protein
MNKYIIIVALLSSLVLFSQEDYQVEMNGEKLDIELNKGYEFKVKGKKIILKFTMKDTLTYKDDFFSFKYTKDFKIAKTEIEEGIEQLMLMTAGGSGLIIQKYKSFNPTLLNELMINEVTKESVNYGFKLSRENYERTLKSGQEIKVDKAVLTYKDDTNIYEVLSIGAKDEGVLVVTMRLDKIEDSKGEKLIELLWNSFEYYK